MSHLITSGEADRVRQDVAVLDQRENANRTGSSMSASNALYNRFPKRLNDSAMAPSPYVVPLSS